MYAKSGAPSGKGTSSSELHVVAEAEYHLKLDKWHEQRMQAWEKGGAKGNAPKKDKAAFTKEMKISTRPKASATRAATVEDYFDQQDLLPYFTWNRSSGFAIVRPEVV